MGAKCTFGPDGGVWESPDVDREHAYILKMEHMEFAHQTQQRSGAHLNVNTNSGVMGGNFVNSVINNPAFYIQSPGRQSSASVAPPSPVK